MILSYAFKVMLISAVLYGYYFLFLRNKRFHQYNRFYILTMAILPLVLPLLQVPLDRLLDLNDESRAITLLKVSPGSWEEPVTITARTGFLIHYFGGQSLIVLAYAGVAGFFLWAFIRSLVYIKKITRSYPSETVQGIRVFQTEEPGTPFSFFRKIFWNSRLDLHSPEGEQVFRHEYFHVREYHSFDILVLEILAVLFWFNPFLFLFKKEMKAIHEFLADQWAVSDKDHYAYAELLVQSSLRGHPDSIVHPFFHSHIKRRILMLTQFRNPRKNYLGRVMTLPLLFILFCAFATRINLKSHSRVAAKTMTIIIDAGHGGIDPGAAANGVLEKDIALSIAKKIQQLASEYNVHVVMTREKDELPGGGKNIHEALRYRTNLVEQTKADLFLSIHVMADPNNPTANGFDMFIPGDGSAMHQKSVTLGSALSGSIRKDYQVAPELKQRETPGIWVLQAATVPSVLLECGYITNEKDLAFINEGQNQEKIARDILQGIVEFGQTNISGSGTESIQQDTTRPGPVTWEGTINKISVKDIKEINILKEKQTIVIKLRSGDSIVVNNVEFRKDSVNHDSKFTIDEMQAQFPGGSPSWTEYLIDNLKYPPDAIRKKVDGVVVVEFVVEKDGTVSNVRAVSGPVDLQAESVRIIEKSGKWMPAVLNGEKVSSVKKQPITFKLNELPVQTILVQ